MCNAFPKSEISTYAYIFLYCVDFYGVNYFWLGNS